MVIFRRYNNISEDTNSIDNDTQEITDQNLQQKKAQLLQQKANAKEQYDRTCQRIDSQIIQLYNQQATINKQNSLKKQNNQQNESVNYSIINEGKNSNHELLAKAILNATSDLDMSYSLSNIEINRLSRKINDVIKRHKNDDNALSEIEYEIKKYLINHNRICLSQSEINSFINSLEIELKHKDYAQFSNIFNQHNDIKIKFTDDTNIDELEAELTDLDFDVIEDLDNNTLTLSNVDDYNLKSLKSVLKFYDLLKNNEDLFF